MTGKCKKKDVNMVKKKYKPSTANYEARKYQIFGSREMWLSEQKEKNKKHKQTQND